MSPAYWAKYYRILHTILLYGNSNHLAQITCVLDSIQDNITPYSIDFSMLPNIACNIELFLPSYHSTVFWKYVIRSYSLKGSYNVI